jgi:pyruvate-ferredoxin/flavodoxin oxidoreductase
MIPNMYKIAGELTPCVIHVAARSLATQALSIFGDHSDVMAARATGFAVLCAGSVQEAHDFALISQVASLNSRVPCLFFFDGFRTSHEIAKISVLDEDIIQLLVPNDRIVEHRWRALSPDRPVVRGTAQNPDVYFQSRETVNPAYQACASNFQAAMDQLAALTGRAYHLFDYHGSPDPDRVIVLMGSGGETVHETVDHLCAQGERVGIVKVRLYRPWDAAKFLSAIPESVRKIAVLDRTKEPGSAGEPLYLDCASSLFDAGRTNVRVIGGRYGLGSKEFTPAMVKGIFDHLTNSSPKNHFTIGITDDLCQTSLDYDPNFSIEPAETVRAVFYGLGSDGTVGANKQSVKIIGEETENFAQAYFVYDSKKSGAVTISHLRFGPRPIRAPYLISKAQLVACHQPNFLTTYPVLDHLAPGGTFLLNTPAPPTEIWERLPSHIQAKLSENRAELFVIDAQAVARSIGMGGRINTIMQTCFFALSRILPRKEAIEAIKESIRKAYGRKGDQIVQMNLHAVDQSLEHLYAVPVPERLEHPNGTALREPPQLTRAHPFVREVLGKMMVGQGDRLPVSALPNDGTFPSGTARFEKRNLSTEVPVWDPSICIQCGKCVFVCPHSVIRSKVCEPNSLVAEPAGFLSAPARLPEWKGKQYTLQVATEDCTGCAICVDVCPVRDKSVAKHKAINMERRINDIQTERDRWHFFLGLPELDRSQLQFRNVREMQVAQPLFEFSGACAGCGETPYIRLLTQLFGDRLLIANATGCSSIYGGNLPTTPYAQNSFGRGPAWSNSLFEDNAEFGLGFRISLDKQREVAQQLLPSFSYLVGDELIKGLLEADQHDEAGIAEQRERVKALKIALSSLPGCAAKRLLAVVDTLVRKSVWLVGGDGWAYDIGYGGLDHVLASGRNINILVLDTEVYSNTGGQCSKATPLGAVAKFATGGKRTGKKDLGLIAMAYENVYVASVAMGAKDEHTLKAFLEAEAYEGPSLIIAYSHCIAHGIEMTRGMQHQKAAVQTGQWLLYRYQPENGSPEGGRLHLDSDAPRAPINEYLNLENRFRLLKQLAPQAAQEIIASAQKHVRERWDHYARLSGKTSPVK